MALLLVGFLVGCGRDGVPSEPDDGGDFPLQLPPGFPFPGSEEEPLTTASVQLGKALFFDQRLSLDGTVSCATCHRPDLAFTDGNAVSLGVEGRTGNRNAPSLGNVAYHASFFRDGGVPTLERQVIAPILDHVEMDHDIHAVASDLKNTEPYRTLSQRAYGRELDAWVITRAIANYERTLISGWSRYDQYLQGAADALSAAEVEGMHLFNSTRANCSACHSGFDLSDHDFHNVGQYQDYADPGRERITLDPADHGKFKTPSLRNVARTAPYMHDGSLATLEEVIDLFASGGHAHPNRSAEMRVLELTGQERADLIAFLHSLNDTRSMDQVR